MTQYKNTLSRFPPRPATQGKMHPVKKNILLTMMVIFLPLSSVEAVCKGRFVNPISDICWSCILPISSGNVSFGGGGLAPAKRDIPNPSSP